MNTISQIEELNNQMEFLWVAFLSGAINSNERNYLSTAIQNELAEAQREAKESK